MRDNRPVKGLLILGFGGHARSVADIASAMGFTHLRFIDPAARDGESYLGYPIESRWDQDLPSGWTVFSAAGSNQQRKAHLEHVQHLGLTLTTLIAPSASLGAGCFIAPGCFVGHQAHVGPQANIGIGCIVNSGAIVEHESQVGSFSHVAVNATVAGRSVVGSENFIGAGATVIDGVTLADNVQLGAGAVAVQDLEVPGLYVGVPAKWYRHLSSK